jgi:hypothetical protein
VNQLFKSEAASLAALPPLSLIYPIPLGVKQSNAGLVWDKGGFLLTVIGLPSQGLRGGGCDNLTWRQLPA